MHLLFGRQNLDLTWADEYAVAIVALEVALALNRAIVLAVLVVELNTNPDTGCERGLADKKDFSEAEIAALDARVEMEWL